MKKERRPLEHYLCIGLFSALILMCFLQVLFRFVLNFSLSWTEELSRYFFIGLVYIGAGLGARQGLHVRVEIIDKYIPERFKKYYVLGLNLLCSAACLVVVYNSIPIIKNSHRASQISAALQLPMWAVYLIIPIMFAIIAVKFLLRGISEYKTTGMEADK